MDEFEFSGKLSFGQYLPGHSAIHRLDARVKLAGAALLLLALVIAARLTPLLFALAALLGATRLGGVPLRYALRSLRPIWPFIVLMAAIQLLAFPGTGAGDCATLWQVWLVRVTTCSLALAALSLLRMLDLLLLINLLAATTTLNEVMHGVEGLLRPLGRLGLPAHELALTLSIALRFVPLLGQETERLMKAQAARGADFGRGRWGFVQRIKRLLPLLIPLFITSLERAEGLAEAMEARGYAGQAGRTHWVQLHARAADYVALLLVIALSAGIIIAPLP